MQEIQSENFNAKRFQAFRLLFNAIIEIEEANETEIYTILSKHLRKICNANYVVMTSYSSQNHNIKVQAISAKDKQDNMFNPLLNKLAAIPLEKACILPKEKSSLTKCNKTNCILKNVVPTSDTIHQSKNTQCILRTMLAPEIPLTSDSSDDYDWYKVSCVHDNDLVAMGLVHMDQSTAFLVEDIIVTYMHLVGITLQRINAVSALQNNQQKLEELNSQLKAHQALLVQQEQLASIGQLAAGVAHEINNPVGFVMSNLGTLTEYVEILKHLIIKYSNLRLSVENENKEKQISYCKQIDQINEDEDIDFMIEDMEQALIESKEGTKRVQTIVQNLKSFARLDSGIMKLENINEGIEASLKLVWNELKYKCKVNKQLGNVPLIKCALNELNQVFMNIILNAGHAIKKEGTIDIKSKFTGTNIEISVSDTGIGIPEKHISRLFEPFFTTKDIGKGTGLGLSISHGIIQKHNGTIKVESEIGKGSTFTIILPCPKNENENAS